MSDEPKGLYKLGGAAFIISGILFLSRDVLEFMAGPPPSSGVQILAWVQSEHGSWLSARDSFPCVSDRWRRRPALREWIQPPTCRAPRR